MNRSMPGIVGNKALCDRLISDIISSSLSHAYIIEGENGSGRKTIALLCAAATACENKSTTSSSLPCLCCNSCKKIMERKSTDVIFIKEEEKASVGVDVSRFIKEDVYVIPNDLEDKFYIIEDADTMTEQAQNALLLTLEEPPSFVHFFLICNSASSFLETVRSRATILHTQKLSEKEISDYICANDTRAAQMKLTAPKEFAEILKASNGGIGQAIYYLDEENREPMLKRRRLIYDTILAIMQKKTARDVLPLLLKFSSKRDALSAELSLLSSAIRDLIVLKKTDSATLEFFCDVNEAIELSDKRPLSFLYEFYNNVNVAIEENKCNANVKLLITKLSINAGIL